MSSQAIASDSATLQHLNHGMNERAEELRVIRELAVVEKHAPTVEHLFRQSAAEASTVSSGIVIDDEHNVQPAPSNPVVASELNQLSTVRRVSGITSRFRNSLEGIFATGASNRRSPAPAHQAITGASVRRNQRSPTPSTVAAAPPAPPLAHEPEAESYGGELRRLMNEALVGRRLRNSRFTDRLERMLRSRVSEPGEAEERARRLHELIASRRARSSERTSLTRNPAALVIGHDALQSVWDARYAHLRHGEEEVVEAVPGYTQQSSEAFGQAAFELLLSMQRTLQQEVSAALHMSALAGKKENAVAYERAFPKHNLGACVICCDKEVSVAFYRCGHMCSCAACAHALCSDAQGKCPICRAPVREILQVFLACAPGSLLPTP
mmetsp:Transcript_31440/g.66209  ORF Transcript_31440/g.66209 Transcript_31440/m.66209 type:complete len:382 (-) Transcript_31440:878-2023(-)